MSTKLPDAVCKNWVNDGQFSVRKNPERSAQEIGKVPPSGVTSEVGFRALALPNGELSP